MIPDCPLVRHQSLDDFETPGMSAVTLRRIEPARNMARFYAMDVQPELFGMWCFMREWGQIGRAGQMRIVPYPNTRIRQMQRPRSGNSAAPKSDTGIGEADLKP
jgi:predicted DNA-binding WGR domain protein